ncbi:MAG: TetR/AcrR family transcriptional regulator [Clostridiaceae bacterium]
MPRTKEQFEEMRLKSRSMIIETSLNLFITKGYHSTSISNIAKEAGVAVGLMYNYFSSKEELLSSIIDENFKQLFMSVTEAMGKDIEILDVKKMIDIIIATIIKQNQSWKLIISVTFQPDISKHIKSKIENFYIHQKDIFLNYFISKGFSKPEESAEVLISILHGAFLNYACTDNIEELQLIRRTVIERLLEEE